jgi:hypothetical protein
MVKKSLDLHQENHTAIIQTSKGEHDASTIS